MQEAKKHILVVDDDTRLRSLLQRYLREQNFCVSAVKDAFDAKVFLLAIRNLLEPQPF